MRKLLTAILLSSILSFVSGQDMLGIISSNYAGLYGIATNPSSMVASRLYMDYNLLGFQGSADNNYAYINRDDFINLVWYKRAPEYYTQEDELRNYNIFRNSSDKFGFQNLKLSGPGAMVVNGPHAFGLTTSFRSVSSFQDMPSDIAVFLYEAIDYEFQHSINYNHESKIRAGSLTWYELAFSYAYNFHRYRWNYWSAGITIKPLFGTAGFYTTIEDLDYQVHADDSASIYNATFEYGISLPVDYSSSEIIGPLKSRGFGIGIDAGITYQRTEKGHSTSVFERICEQPYDEYNYRIGFSILDFGFIRFNKNAVNANYKNTSAEWYEPYDTLAYSSVNSIVEKIDGYFAGNAESYEPAKSFTMYLPFTLSLQADIKLKPFVYVNLTTFYGLKVGKKFLYRPAVVSIAPRYETARWEFSMPVSFFEWQYAEPRIGIALRYGNIFAGIDRLNTLLGITEFTGLDFYAGIRLNLTNNFKMNFIKGNCGMKKMYNIETFDYRNF